MSFISTSRNKTIPPQRRAELLSRKRLLDMLFDSLDKKLTLISAPAGYGKTSLLLDLAQHSELPFCWLSLDELDNNPQRFIAYLIAAISEKFPTFGVQSKETLAGLKSIEQDMERLIVTLVNEIYEQIHEHFILALDDFHLLEGNEIVHYFLNRLLQLADDNFHLVISSRTLIVLPDLTLMIAREQVSGLSYSELAFQPEELQALVKQNTEGQISDEEAQRLIEKTEGWITGLQFAGVKTNDSKSPLPPQGAETNLFDYLGRQVLDRQPPLLRDFLLRTSLLDEFDASLCKAVFSPLYPKFKDWHGLVNSIVKNNLFVLPIGADKRWLRYHHLFRDFLRELLERERPEEIRPILIQLGKVYEERNEWEKARYVYKQLGDMELLAEMIERSSFFMLQRALLTVDLWVNELPPSLTRTRPGLLSVRGTIAFMKGNQRDGLELLNQAIQIYRRKKNISGLTLALARRATNLRFLGDYTASLLDADEVIQLTEESDEDLQTLNAEALRVKGLALYRLGQAKQAVDFLERSLKLFIRINDASSIPILLMETGIAYRALGNLMEAGRSYEQALQIWRKDGNLMWQASLLNNIGDLYHAQGKYEEAVFAFEDGLICAQRTGYARLDALISVGLGDLYTELEDFDLAIKNYRHAAEIIRNMEDRFLLHSLYLAQANLALCQKDFATIERTLSVASDSIISSHSHYEIGHLCLLQGRARLLEKKVIDAILKFNAAESHFGKDGRELDGIVARLWLAATHNINGNQVKAIQIIKALPEIKEERDHRILITIHQMRGWLEGLQKNPIIGNTIRDLFVRANRISDGFPAVRRQLRRQASVVKSFTPSLTIQALGYSIVNAGGKNLTISDWQTQSVRDLFFYFLTNPKPLTKEQIAQTLWPEIEEPARIKLRFKNELYRLRRAVGLDTIRFEGVYYSFNHSQDYEYDVEAFESYISKARLSEDLEERIGLYQKAVKLVRGPFLEDVYADWVMFERERLSRLYLSALTELANLLQKQARLEESIQICQRALEYDPVFEPAYRLLMQVYDRLGDQAAIIRTYLSCRDSLQRVLDSPPAKETDELYRELTQ